MMPEQCVRIAIRSALAAMHTLCRNSSVVRAAGSSWRGVSAYKQKSRGFTLGLAALMELLPRKLKKVCLRV